jgi:hypothetical protein
MSLRFMPLLSLVIHSIWCRMTSCLVVVTLMVALLVLLMQRPLVGDGDHRLAAAAIADHHSRWSRVVIEQFGGAALPGDALDKRCNFVGWCLRTAVVCSPTGHAGLDGSFIADP